MGYNTWEEQLHALPGQNWVSDLVLECEAEVGGSDGELVLELSKGPDRFRARFNLADGNCKLVRVTGGPRGTEEELGSAKTSVKGKGTYRLRFANVDDRLLVWVGNRLPFQNGVNYSPAKNLKPDEKNDLEPASIGAEPGAQVKVRKIKLFRDTYYTTNLNSARDADVKFDPANKDTWADLANMQPSTYYVQPGHYLCLGDNSPESSDGRSWGLVPRRLMLGKALLIYYPFSRAGRIR